MQKKIYCGAQYLPKNGCKDRLLNTLKSLEEGSRKDPIYIQYRLQKQLPACLNGRDLGIC